MGRRFAAIADIHGNADALAAVLADIDAQGISEIANLGDLLSGPLDPAGTLALIRARSMGVIRGNHDRWLVERDPAEMGHSDRVAHAALTAEGLEWLRGLPAVLDWQGVLLCHATPGDDLTYWLEEVREGGAVAPRGAAGVAALLGDVSAPLVLCGHTHTARAVQIGGTLIVNPGAVGQPSYEDDVPVPHVMQSGDPAARYAVLEEGPAGWSVSFRRVPYDTARMVAAARSHGREDWARAVGTGWWR